MRRHRERGATRETEVIDRLAKRYGKYALVVGVARRAHDLKERIDASLEPSSGALINRAIGEIALGDVRIRGAKSEEDETD
jgi:DNA-directed RNA polymerase subunit K/omega